MKTKSDLHFKALVVAGCILLGACSSGQKEKALSTEESSTEHAAGSEAAEAESKPQFEVDASFQQQLGNVYTAYLSLKDAFVATDGEKVKTEATATASALKNVDMKLLSGAAHNDWMAYQSLLEKSLADIASQSDIEQQRKSFSNLSDNLYKSIKAFGLGDKTAFYEFCPMAFNNEGAYWLSDQEKIRNPYFGDKMMTCGMVKEKL